MRKLKKTPSRDNSPYVEKKKTKVNLDLKIRDLPWKERQLAFLELAADKDTRVIITKGVAGTAKTILAVHASLTKLNDKRISEIFYSRVPVESSVHGIGFIKGDQDEKMNPYIQPMVDKLNELLPVPQVKELINGERLTGLPLGFLRGLNISNAAMILDEAQNCRVADFLLVMSRMATFSTLFICGDDQQSDIKNSGFNTVYDLFDNEESRKAGIYTVAFDHSDIVRSKELSFIIKKFESLG
jgi:phosphate starvation-inducible PhoH-like protein